MRIVFYKNSFLASLVSIFGYTFLMISLVGFFSENDITLGIIMLALAIIFIPWAAVISENKTEKKWWKEITSKIPQSEIMSSKENILMVCSKSPKANRTYKRCLKANPELVMTVGHNCKKCGKWNQIAVKKCSCGNKLYGLLQ